ncbi:MAG: hypothetical protein AB7S26_01135 [Sandaracinaceae bacterium]
MSRPSFRARAVRSAWGALIRNGALFVAIAVLHAIGLAHAEDVRDALPSAALAWPLLALVGWRITVAIRRLRDPSRHPILQEFAPYGDPLALAAEVERMVETGHATMVDSWIFTDRFIVGVGFAHDVIATDEVVWFYPKETRHSVNFIPVGTTRTLCVVGTRDRHVLFPIELTLSQAALDRLVEVAPRAHRGYSPELDRLRRARPARFAAEVRAMEGSTEGL